MNLNLFSILLDFLANVPVYVTFLLYGSNVMLRSTSTSWPYWMCLRRGICSLFVNVPTIVSGLFSVYSYEVQSQDKTNPIQLSQRCYRDHKKTAKVCDVIMLRLYTICLLRDLNEFYFYSTGSAQGITDTRVCVPMQRAQYFFSIYQCIGSSYCDAFEWYVYQQTNYRRAVDSYFSRHQNNGAFSGTHRRPFE